MLIRESNTSLQPECYNSHLIRKKVIFIIETFGNYNSNSVILQKNVIIFSLMCNTLFIPTLIVLFSEKLLSDSLMSEIDRNESDANLSELEHALESKTMLKCGRRKSGGVGTRCITVGMDCGQHKIVGLGIRRNTVGLKCV